jgi:hypothetical protein
LNQPKMLMQICFPTLEYATKNREWSYPVASDHTRTENKCCCQKL